MTRSAAASRFTIWGHGARFATTISRAQLLWLLAVRLVFLVVVTRVRSVANGGDLTIAQSGA